MITRVYKASPELIQIDSDIPRAWMQPPAGDEVPQIQSAQERLQEMMITFADGASASFDVFTNTLSVTNTQANQDLVESWIEHAKTQTAHQMVFGLTVVAGPGEAIRQMNEAVSRGSDAVPGLAALLQDSQARVVGEAFLNAPVGVRATTRSVQEHHHPAGFSLNSEGRLCVDQEVVASGLALELHAILQHDRTTIELTGSLELNPEPASESRVSFSTPSADQQVFVPLPQTTSLRSTFGTSIRDGETRLVGIAVPPRVNQRGRSDVLWASFLTAHEVRMDAPPLVIKAPASKAMAAPAGMQAAAFQVPAGMLENAGGDGRSVQQFLEAKGVPPAPGAEAVVEGEVLSVVNTAANIERIAVVIHHMTSALPHTVAVTLHTVQGSGPYLREQAKQAGPLADHGKLWAEIEQRTAAGEHALKITNTARVDFRSKTKGASLAAVREHKYLASYGEDEKTKKVQPGFEVSEVGTMLGLSASTSRDGMTQITLNATTHSQPPQAPRQASAEGTTDKHAIPPVTDFQVQESTTELIVPNGGMRLVSLTRPHGIGGDDTVQATFLRCDVSPQSTKLHPLPKLPEPLRSPEVDADPNKQYTRAFRVAPDFLSIGEGEDDDDSDGDDGSVADPFAAPSTGDAGSGVMVRKTAKQILEEAGISFPPEAGVHTGGATSQLVVRNTQENLDKVEAFIHEMNERNRQLPTVLTTHVIEAPAALLRQVMAGMGGRSDHRVELEQVLKLVAEGKATALATSRVEARAMASGQDEQGVRHAFLDEPMLDEQGRLSLSEGSRLVGLRHEVEFPRRTSDVRTVKLTLSSEFHTAPPITHDERVADANGRIMTFPLTDFHVMRLSTRTIIPAGTARLLAVWKPEGRTGGEAGAGDVLQAMFVTCEVLEPE